MEERKVVYSGIQPTGCITLGNYIGAVNNWIKMQDDDSYSCIYAIADLHSLTVRQVPSELRNRTLSFFAQYLACGLSPEKNILYVQSHVPQHTELAWLLDCYTYVGEMSRMTQFKDKSAKNADNINMGLLNYPVLMAADILLYNTNLVPIGIDQTQHLEITRDIAIRFNNLYSPTFVVPEGYIPKIGSKVMSLQDPASKMSKSDKNENATISIIDDNDAIVRKIKRAVTDSDTKIYFDQEKKPGVSNLLTIYSICADSNMEDVQEMFRSLTYKDLKERTADAVVAKIGPIRDKYLDLLKNKDYINEVAKMGAERAQRIAYKTVAKVKKKVGLLDKS